MPASDTFASGMLIRWTDNPLGITYTLNFSKPFDTKDNITALFVPIYALGGAAVNNIAPNFASGGLLYNDYQYFGYGGMTFRSAAYPEPLGTAVRGYRAFTSQVPDFTPGPVEDNLDGSVTRFVAYGGAASAPSENLAWYFSGLRSPTGGLIYDVERGGTNETTLPSQVSDTLITLSLEKEQRPNWTNKTLPKDIPGRAGAELVWVPVGTKGILVALGGVVDPSFIKINGRSGDPDNNVSVYCSWLKSCLTKCTEREKSGVHVNYRYLRCGRGQMVSTKDERWPRSPQQRVCCSRHRSGWYKLQHLLLWRLRCARAEVRLLRCRLGIVASLLHMDQTHRRHRSWARRAQVYKAIP